MQEFCLTVWMTIFSIVLASPPCSFAVSAERAEEVNALPDLPHPNLESLNPNARSEIQKAYTLALARPRDASANGKLGMLLHAYGLLADAEICYRRAHLLDPSSFQWAYYLGIVQVIQAKCSDAIPTVQEALRLRPDYFPAQVALGECLVVSREWGEARNLYDTLLHKHPESAEAQYGLGRVREGEKDLTGAVESYRRASELFPKFSAAHFALWRIYQRLGKPAQAQEERDLAKQSGGESPIIEDALIAEVESLYQDPEAYLKLGTKLGGEGKWNDAAEAYEEALNINPKLPQAHVRLIYLYTQLGQVTRAEEHFRAALSLNPQSAGAYFYYGLLVSGQGRPQDAEEAFQNALKIDPKYAEAHNNLGFLLEGRGKLREAIEEFRKALETSPDFPQAHFSLGRILVKEGRFEEGIPHLLRAVAGADEGTKPSYLYALGVAYADLGDLENGLRYLHLAGEKAEMEKQTSLLKRIDDDRRLLEGEGGPP